MYELAICNYEFRVYTLLFTVTLILHLTQYYCMFIIVRLEVHSSQNLPRFHGCDFFLFFTYSTFTVIFCMNYQLQLWISRLTLTLFYLWLLNMATIGGWEEGRYELWLPNATKDLYFSIWPQGGWEEGRYELLLTNILYELTMQFYCL